jgi:TIR domain
MPRRNAEAARRICDALRAKGIEVWFDQSELRGGEAWDRKIRSQIRDCALFVPLISANTASRLEGYFRLEWKLAVDRTHLMAAERGWCHRMPPTFPRKTPPDLGPRRHEMFSQQPARRPGDRVSPPLSPWQWQWRSSQSHYSLQAE